MKILYGEDLVNELRSNSDNIKERLWIAVPYIGGLKSVRKIIGKNWIGNSNLSVRLLTDTNEFTRFNSETIQLFNDTGTIRHLAGLHAKIFITDNACLITSANLTNTAFSKRHEIGMFLDGANSIKAIAIFNEWWKKSQEVSPDNLKKYAKKQFISTEEGSGSGLPVLWNLPEDPGEADYWLKPIGVTGDPIPEDELFNAGKKNLHFSKQKPKGVKVNDILIAYGVGVRKILSIYKVISAPTKVKHKNRWPWFVSGQNLTPNFGKKWAQHNIYVGAIRDEYLKTNPNGYITKVKGDTLGGLNYGKDKLNLDPDFARFIIQRVKLLNAG